MIEREASRELLELSQDDGPSETDGDLEIVRVISKEKLNADLTQPGVIGEEGQAEEVDSL